MDTLGITYVQMFHIFPNNLGTLHTISGEKTGEELVDVGKAGGGGITIPRVNTINSRVTSRCY